MSRRVFSLLLRLLPRAFRDEYGADMQAAFAAKVRDARSRGVLSGIWLLTREIAGILRTSVTLRLPRPARNGAGADRTKLGIVEHAIRELRHSLRRLRQTPGFTAACLVTLALAIGANVAIFTVVHRVVLAPLPFEDSDRLMALDHTAPGVGITAGLGMSTGLYREYGTLPAVADIALYKDGHVTVTGLGDAEQTSMLYATPSLLDVLHLRTAHGRWFSEAEGLPDGPAVVVLAHDFWTRHFGSDRNVLGRTVLIDGTARVVIGVMPRAFGFPDRRAQLILPLQIDLTQATAAGFNFQGIARVAEDVDEAAVRRLFDGVIADSPRRFPDQPEITAAMTGDVGLASLAESQKSYMLGNTAQTLWVVLGAVLVVLLIACVNLANLFMSRADARQREVAVRKALGASRGEIATLFLSESLLVVVASSVVGIALAWGAIRALLVTATIPLPRLDELRIAGAELGFAALIAVIAGACFGLIPMLSKRPAVAAVLQDAGRGNSASRGRMRARQLLMATQVALALMLLVAAGLMTQSFLRLQRVDPGFDADARLVFRIGLPEAGYATREQTAQFHERMLERIRSIPGVQSAALATILPLEGEGSGDPLDVEGRQTLPGVLNPVVRYRRVSPDYFAAVGTQLQRGRLLNASDAAGRKNDIVIDEALAALYFPGEDPIGRRVRMLAQSGEWLTIVGIAGNTSTSSVSEKESIPKLYAPMRLASDGENGLGPVRTGSYVVRTAGDPVAIVPGVRRALEEIDPSVAMARPERFTDLVDRTNATTAMTMVLLVIAGSVSLLIGIIGVYAVISFSVGQRAGEIGVRLALGARPGDVAGMIMRQSGIIIAFGIAAGIGGALAGTRILQSLLYGVASRDPLTFAAVAAGLFAVAMLASSVPAWRAAKQNPLDSLRT